MTLHQGVILAAADTETVVEPANVGVGSVVLTVVAAAVIGWLAYLYLSSRRRRQEVEETPLNLQPYLSDDEMETNRVTRVLNAAVLSAAVLAIFMPIYYMNEGGRQAAAADEIAHSYVEEGEHWYESFSCIDCHGPDGGGGGAPYTEARSDLSTSWSVPSLNDIFLRYNEEEVRHWITYGRAGTPMPANGLEGGGAMTIQEIDQTLAYLRSIQISQEDAFAKTERSVTAALDRIASGDAVVARLLLEQETAMVDTVEAPERFAVIADYPTEVRELLAGDGTCTAASAAAVGSSCDSPGQDTDRDGLSDAAEEGLNVIAASVDETVLVRQVRDQTFSDGSPVLDDEGNRVPEVVTIQDPSLPEMYGVELDPTQAYSQESATGEPIPDLERATVFLRELDAAHLTLSVLTERNDVFITQIQGTIDFLEEAAATRPWAVDFDQVAADMGVGASEAERAVGLFNAYCARCHTAGYSAGVAFEQSLGTGAWGPSLVGGRAVVQFPEFDDHVDFIIGGSDDAVAFGINGLGTGRMPGFGRVLSAEDIELIAQLERSLP